MNRSRAARERGSEIIDEAEILRHLEVARHSTTAEALEVIAKAREGKGLELDEAALLLQHPDLDVVEPLLLAAHEVKEQVYGHRVVLFAPLYISNECRNECLYCAFRRGHQGLRRKTLTAEEVQEETSRIIRSGQKRVLLVSAEGQPQGRCDALCRAIEAVYSAGEGHERIRRVNVNAAPLSPREFGILKAQGIGTYQLFQETYHQQTYKEMHPRGPKSDSSRRLDAIDQAMEAGIDDIGLGVLLGLYDSSFEVLGLLQHVRHLTRAFGVGPHTLSVPRLEPAEGAPLAGHPPAPVDDWDFLRIIAILRLAVPYSGIILSTREAPGIRAAALSVGVSQMSAGSRTSPGGYGDEPATTAQFEVGDHRSLEEVVADLTRRGYLPSFCTACYRSERTGHRFMELARGATIGKLCLPNGLITFQEYLQDHASAPTRQAGQQTLEQGLEELGDGKMRQATLDRLERISRGERDLFF